MPAKLVQLARAELSPTITPLAEKLIFVNSLNIYMASREECCSIFHVCMVLFTGQMQP